IERGGKLIGFNVSVGGSLGASHGEPATYPRLASLIGFCPVEQTVQVAEQIVCVQRDFGDRRDRKHARLKYTIDDRGLDWFKGELESRLGFALGPVEPFEFAHNGDRFGWTQDDQGLWHLTLFIPGGRIIDTPERPLLTGMREIAKAHTGEIHFTTNQNVIIAKVAEADKARIEALAHQYGLNAGQHLRPFARDAMACVALPTY